MTRPLQAKQVLLDTRLGGKPRYVLAAQGELMKVTDEVIGCVVFIASRSPKTGSYRIWGTGFLVGFTLSNGGEADYLLTARHVFEDVRNDSDGRVYVRANLKGGNAEYIATSEQDWRTPGDDRIDVAAVSFQLPDNLDHLAIPVEMLATAEVFGSYQISVGNSLFFPGLFHNHAGNARNAPIVRFGDLAGIPADFIQTDRGPMRAYLAEARSIGGLSGSPVFVLPGSFPVMQNMFCLGLIHGHYGVRETPADSAADGIPLTEDQVRRSVNKGIAIVVPAESILETLNHPDFVELRRQMTAQNEERKRVNLPECD